MALSSPRRFGPSCRPCPPHKRTTTKPVHSLQAPPRSRAPPRQSNPDWHSSMPTSTGSSSTAPNFYCIFLDNQNRIFHHRHILSMSSLGGEQPAPVGGGPMPTVPTINGLAAVVAAFGTNNSSAGAASNNYSGGPLASSGLLASSTVSGGGGGFSGGATVRGMLSEGGGGWGGWPQPVHAVANLCAFFAVGCCQKKVRKHVNKSQISLPLDFTHVGHAGKEDVEQYLATFTMDVTSFDETVVPLAPLSDGESGNSCTLGRLFHVVEGFATALAKGKTGSASMENMRDLTGTTVKRDGPKRASNLPSWLPFNNNSAIAASSSLSTSPPTASLLSRPLSPNNSNQRQEQQQFLQPPVSPTTNNGPATSPPPSPPVANKRRGVNTALTLSAAASKAVLSLLGNNNDSSTTSILQTQQQSDTGAVLSPTSAGSAGDATSEQERNEAPSIRTESRAISAKIWMENYFDSLMRSMSVHFLFCFVFVQLFILQRLMTAR